MKSEEESECDACKEGISSIDYCSCGIEESTGEGNIGYIASKILPTMEQRLKSEERKLQVIEGMLFSEKQVVKLLINTLNIITEFTKDELINDLVKNVIEQVRLAKQIDIREEANKVSEKKELCTLALCGEHPEMACEACKAKMKI